MYVPARNAERTLAACIDAIRAQTRPPDDPFIVVDPRSTDRTGGIAAATGIRVIEQQGSTLGAARNQAITAAAHRWLACCDSDVIIEADWLDRLAARRGENPVGIGGRTNENVRSPFDAWRALHMPHHWGDYPLRNPFMLVSEVLFDRRALIAVGGYRHDLNYYEDSDLCQRLRDAGYDLLYEPSAVAVHQRTDTLPDLLTLRWKYSEYRQGHLMDRYAGLLDKCRVNREYALNTLSRSLARGKEELSYVSFLLFFHHLLMDLRSLLSRRPLITQAARTHYERELVASITSTLADRHPDLSRAVHDDLSDKEPRASARPVPSPRKDHPTGDEDLPLGAPPGWNHYLDRVRDTITRFCAEFSVDLLAVIDSSARYVHSEAAANDLRRLPPPSPDALRAAVNGIPVQPFVDEAFCQAIRDHWPDTTGIQIIGPLTDQERSAIDDTGLSCQGSVTHAVGLVAHLEARPEPLGVFDETDARVSRLVLCYQAPARFVPGLDVVSASDLASAAAAAGWTIERFDTLIGRTRLMLTR